MTFNVHITDDRGQVHGWTIDRDTAIAALARGDEVLAEDNPGRRRVSAEVYRASVAGRPEGPPQTFGAA